MRKSNQPEDEREPVHELGDIIDAREERQSAFADDVDACEDIEIPDNIDVDDALTFPHPRSGHKKGQRQQVDVDRAALSSEFPESHDRQETDFSYDDSEEEMLPTDYEGGYNEATTTEVADDDDEVIENIVNHAGDMDADDVLYEEEMLVPLPPHFTGEETEEQTP